jgi:hypothetical protein
MLGDWLVNQRRSCVHSVGEVVCDKQITLYNSYTSLEPIASCRSAINALCELALSSRSWA